MTLIDVGIFVLRAFVVVMFTLHVAVFLTWADRRQGAMIQDRVGPNRAVIWLPTRLAQALALGPAVLAAAVVVLVVLKFEPTPEARTTRALWFSQLAILFTWVTGIVIAGIVRNRGVKNSFDAWIQSVGDPRRIFFLGLAAHVVTLLVGASFRGTTTGLLLRDVGYGASVGILILMILFGAAYAAYAIRNEPRVGLRVAGLLHAAADGLKTLFKEDFIPPHADRLLHSLAPLIAFFPALVVLGVVPFGDTLCFATKDGQTIWSELLQSVPSTGVCTEGAVRLQVVNLDVGLLYFFALAGTGIVGAALAGWASDNKYSLLGGLRAASQMVSYEVTMGLTLVGAIMVYGTLRVDEMIRWQSENAWGIFVQPVAFLLFFAAAVAESKRIPFDMPEGESEIVAGYYTEYAGMKFAMFFFAEYVAVVTSGALMAAIFLGGWDLPFLHRDGLHVVIGGNVLFEQALPHGIVVLLGALGFAVKSLALCWLQLMIRWTLPRFRYDQLMRLGWRKLLPASLVNIFITGLLVLAIQAGGVTVDKFMTLLADLTRVALAVGSLAAVILAVLFVLRPAHKRRSTASTSAQFAAAAGGTRSIRMEA